MESERRTQSRVRVGVIAALTALACLGTMVIRIPIPATTGYFNIGDIFVILAGLWLGPVGGLTVGALGPTIADAIGFPVFIPATFFVKGFEGLVVGVVGGGKGGSVARKIVAAGLGAVVVVVGYFVFEAFIYPGLGQHIPVFAVTDIGAAIIEVVPNTVQGIVGAVGGVGLWKAVSGARENL
ncbi:MAG: ECF transporter S component [Nitrospirae bacterium]|nr:ECF transporter S component [Nitrospirota bacterium]